MITFYKNETTEMYRDDSYLTTMLFVIDRPSTPEDALANPTEYAAYTTPVAPVEPTPVVASTPATIEPTA